MNAIKCCPPLLIFDRYRNFSENIFDKIELPYPNDNVQLFKNEHLLQQMARNTENHSQSKCKLWNRVPTNVFIIQLETFSSGDHCRKWYRNIVKGRGTGKML